MSTVETFEQKIDQQLKADPTSKFFLCTDDSEVKTQLCNKYGDSIITYQSVLNRYSKRGIIDAVVELWSLASTKEIWGSYYSSYSEMAAAINGIELKIVRQDQ